LWDKEAASVFSHKNLTDISLSLRACLSHITRRPPFPPMKNPIRNWCMDTARVKAARELDPTIGLVLCLEKYCPRYKPEYPYCILMTKRG
jgi:hypothetical protein